MPFRLMPRLDVKGENLVKGIRLEGLRVLGTPDYFARVYSEAGADELLYVDAVASLYGRNSLLSLVSRTAEAIFIPITVGGGVRSLDDVRALLEAGADKVAINTAALERPGLIDEVAHRFGSSTVVLSVQAKRNRHGDVSAYMNNGRDNSRRDAFEWAREAVERGVGEVLVTAVDLDGTGRGFDLDIAERMTATVRVPVVACGGAGTISHMIQAAAVCDALAFGSTLHYRLVRDLVAEGHDFGSGGEFKVLENRRLHSRIDGERLEDVKAALAESGFHAR